MQDPMAFIIAISHITATIALFNGFITCIAQSKIVIAAMESITRQPEVASDIRTTMFVGAALSETGGIYGLLIAIIMLFANPLIPLYLEYFDKLPK